MIKTKPWPGTKTRRGFLERQGVLGVVDRIPLSYYRKLSKLNRNKLMAAAFKAKNKMERAQEFAYKVYSKLIARENYLAAARIAKEYELALELELLKILNPD